VLGLPLSLLLSLGREEERKRIEDVLLTYFALLQVELELPTVEESLVVLLGLVLRIVILQGE
jgi:hypothetical protein